MADGPACFPRGFPCPAVLRIRLGGRLLSATGLLPPMAGLSRPVRLTGAFVTPCETSYNPGRQAFRFGLLRVRSPLLTESRLFSLPQGTEMFQFPWCASAAAMDSLQGDRALPRPGFPIRTSPDRCLLTAPRGHIAVRRVLLRLLVPRHPPCALHSLT